MSDLLQRLVSRALGRANVVRPVVGTRFGREPELLSERGPEPGPEAPRLPAPALPSSRERTLPPADEEDRQPPGD